MSKFPLCEGIEEQLRNYKLTLSRSTLCRVSVLDSNRQVRLLSRSKIRNQKWDPPTRGNIEIEVGIDSESLDLGRFRFNRSNPEFVYF